MCFTIFAGLAHKVWIPPAPWSVYRSVTGMDSCHSSCKENAEVCWFGWHRSFRYESIVFDLPFPVYIIKFFAFLSQMNRHFSWFRPLDVHYQMKITKLFSCQRYTVVHRVNGLKGPCLPGPDEISTGGQNDYFIYIYTEWTVFCMKWCTKIYNILKYIILNILKQRLLYKSSLLKMQITIQIFKIMKIASKRQWKDLLVL